MTARGNVEKWNAVHVDERFRVCQPEIYYRSEVRMYVLRGCARMPPPSNARARAGGRAGLSRQPQNLNNFDRVRSIGLC